MAQARDLTPTDSLDGSSSSSTASQQDESSSDISDDSNSDQSIQGTLTANINGNAESPPRWDTAVCRLCRSGNHESILLLCDSCDAAEHSCCIGLTEIPKKSWRCTKCKPPVPQQPVSTKDDGLVDDATLVLAAPVRLDDTEIWCINTPITFSIARRETLWISRTETGFTFCLRCNCQKSIVPSSDPRTGATHVALSSFFHDDPFVNDRALQHFSTVHGDRNLSIKTMIEKYESKGTCVYQSPHCWKYFSSVYRTHLKHNAIPPSPSHQQECSSECAGRMFKLCIQLA